MTCNDMVDFADFDVAILTVEGSTVANVMLRQLMEAMGEPIHARPVSPEAVWREMLDKIRTAAHQQEEKP